MTLSLANVTIDCTDPRELAGFWTQALGWTVAFDFDGEFVMLSSPGTGSGNGTSLSLQRVTEPRSGKNRVHMDFAADDRVAEVRRLVGLGATELAGHKGPGLTWTVLADPEGNEFCVAQHD
ncbi:VOC family protein [Saccharomonospora xinjiangensis]|uniref:Lactoylglutathione lyase family protein n=1 Tax=Saccharomonospora xinjiangensis XJ-54 TaxID=882086 RepID=I0UZB4_9PSEU|nr:VOC family protein [Saccharomonospora xinjiangensis]EID53217.1 lactoylglutathione lyase family protein [Saccharomonospora xinjiangensis XJ-54]